MSDEEIPEGQKRFDVEGHGGGRPPFPVVLVRMWYEVAPSLLALSEVLKSHQVTATAADCLRLVLLIIGLVVDTTRYGRR
jgi:hypothetical protein